MASIAFRYSGRFLTILLTLGLVGCNELVTIMRDELAIESEALDRINLVEDEAAAKIYCKIYEEPVRKKIEILSVKKIEYVQTFEKGPKAVWMKFDDLIHETLSKPIDSKTFELIDELGRSDAPDKLVEKMKEIMKKEDAEMKIKTPTLLPQWEKFLSKQSEWDKVMEPLPSPKVINHYLREKLALKILKEREANRLQVILAAAAGTAPSVGKVYSHLVTTIRR